jgi:hypothetical protein
MCAGRVSRSKTFLRSRSDPENPLKVCITTVLRVKGSSIRYRPPRVGLSSVQLQSAYLLSLLRALHTQTRTHQYVSARFREERQSDGGNSTHLR